jgi:hypothetical protein
MAEETGWWAEITRTRRRMIFFYDLVWIVVLGLIGLMLLNAYDCTAPKAAPCCLLALFKPCSLFLIKYKLFINCMWCGALGGATISMKGIYDHGNPNDPWSNAFNLWHIGRPVSGAVAGLIVAMLFLLVFPGTFESRLVLYGVAFIFGTQDAAFFNFLSQFASRFVQSNSTSAAGGVRINSVSPLHAGPGAIITIQGQGFEPEAIVKVGSQPLKDYTMTPNGTTISAVIPRLPEVAVGANQAVDVIVSNKSNSSAALVGKFTYGPQPAEPTPHEAAPTETPHH